MIKTYFHIQVKVKENSEGQTISDTNLVLPLIKIWAPRNIPYLGNSLLILPAHQHEQQYVDHTSEQGGTPRCQHKQNIPRWNKIMTLKLELLE